MNTSWQTWADGNNSAFDGAFFFATDTVTGVMATLGNLFTFLVIRVTSDTDVPDGTRVFMLTLTFTDLLIGITFLISLITRATEVNEAGIFICKGNAVVQLALFIMSISVLVIIGVDRCLAVTRPLRYLTLITKRRATVTTIIVSSLIMAFTLIVISLHKVTYEPYIMGCYPSITTYCMASAFLHSFTILLPNAVLVGIYTKLMKVSHHQAVRIRQQPVPAHNREGRNDQPPHLPGVRSFAEWKALRMLLLVNLAFLITWLPRFIADLYTCYFNFDNTAIFLQALSYVTTSSSSWVNPIIYILTSKMFRKNALKLLKLHQN